MVSFMLAKEYVKGIKAPKNDPDCLPPIGWFVSEKFDGYRARYMGEEPEKVFLSRQNKLFYSPQWFKDAMPDVNLDGELWVGRDNFQEMGVVRQKNPAEDGWTTVQYLVYDLPDVDEPFHVRTKMLEEIVKEAHQSWNEKRNTLPEKFHPLECPLVYTQQTKIRSHSHLESVYQEIIKQGGEGVMIKHPESIYEDKRSNYMLKYKPSFDEEAIIIDYKEGKGKYKGMLGGFICKPLINKDTYHIVDPNEHHEFAISGMDDEVRESYKQTHPIGTVISYEHSGKTGSGKPRFARYLRLRTDITIKEPSEDTQPDSTVFRDNLVKIFQACSDYERKNGNVHPANSYKRVIPAIKRVKDDRELTDDFLKEIKGLGAKLLLKAQEIRKTGTCKMYDTILSTVDPRDEFMKIHGVGPKKAKELVDSGFTEVKQLRECENIHVVLNYIQQKGLTYFEDFQKRIPYEEIKKHEKVLKQQLSLVDEDADLTIAGSYRRQKETSGDIDVLLKAKSPKTYKKYIETLVSLGYLVCELANGTKKYNGVCKLGWNGMPRRIDIMYTKPSEYPFAIFYFTGSDEFNKKIRSLCLDKGMSINEYSLKDSETKKPVKHKFNTELDIFEYLQIDYVEPCNR